MKNLIYLTTICLALGLFMACNNAPKGEKAVTEAAKKVEEVVATKMYRVASDSRVAWTGSKISGKHTGTFNVGDGKISVDNGKVTSAKVMIDITTLACTDLKAGEGKEKLEGHLLSADFFDAENNPKAMFNTTSISDAGNGMSNVTGNLNLMGTTKSITFPAKITVTDTGVDVVSEDFTINRTDFNMKYGSATFFDDLKDKAINDAVGLKINLKAYSR